MKETNGKMKFNAMTLKYTLRWWKSQSSISMILTLNLYFIFSSIIKTKQILKKEKERKRQRWAMNYCPCLFEHVEFPSFYWVASQVWAQQNVLHLDPPAWNHTFLWWSVFVYLFVCFLFFPKTLIFKFI